MKRILAVLLLVMLLVAAIPATSLAAGAVSNGDTKVWHTTAKNGLHLRAAAGLDAKIYTTLPYGTALVKKGSKTIKKDGYTWIKVRTMNGMTGWVWNSKLAANGMANVNTKKDGLNVRKYPNTSKKSVVLTSIPHGQKNVKIYAINGNWCKVKWNGMTGYASKGYLKWTTYKG